HPRPVTPPAHPTSHPPPPLPVLHSFPTRRSSDLHCRRQPRPFRQVHRGRKGQGIHVPHRGQHLSQLGRHRAEAALHNLRRRVEIDRKSTRLNSSHQIISYAVFCLKKKKI